MLRMVVVVKVVLVVLLIMVLVVGPLVVGVVILNGMAALHFTPDTVDLNYPDIWDFSNANGHAPDET